MRLVAAIAVLVAWTADARPTRACSAAHPRVESRATVPEDGATAVPINARILVEYELSDYYFVKQELEPALELRGPAGEVVAAAVTSTKSRRVAVFVIDPGESLAPMATYTLHDTTVLPCDLELDAPCRGERVQVATFTTGDGPDVTPPTASNVVVSTVYAGDLSEDSTCDWDGTFVEHEVDVWGPIADDEPEEWIRYVYLDAAGNLVAGPLPVSSLGHTCLESPYQPTYDVYFEDDRFAVRAIDLAGNTEVVAHVLEGEPCADAAGDSGVDYPDPGGCGCSSGGGAAPAMALLLMAGLWRGRRADRRR